MNLSASGSITIGGSATLSATYGPTGRLVTADSDYALVREWAELPDQDLQQSHQAVARFATHLSQVVRLPGVSLSCCRGSRRFPSGYVPTSDEMGPPPTVAAAEGRYNRSGESTLYLCESEGGLAREPIAGDGPLWIQRFVLPTERLSIADFSSLHADGFASKVFWFAELAGNEDVVQRLHFSQLVASLVRQKFDGMRIPGVRGTHDVRYSNVVIFGAEPSWRDWLEIGAQPKQAAPDGFV